MELRRWGIVVREKVEGTPLSSLMSRGRVEGVNSRRDFFHLARGDGGVPGGFWMGIPDL
jgi:hypothetical protein